ncbi:hypothetical protein pneo_cds_320 [Pandoravirus neocaledonia]|uniref:Uncharacterized protein n=1 Tax=Pandoravirus neocaledonia TaxID=2107708 RepID=A0A2U7UBU3_9VIRU|nr:hypothetical protein pneo_cds_320 [Pandoravirus neocaledonia]AVK75927.1 hypothetical protein pneo_cds_320 [Pandoravirus neocaledonia]
MGDDAFAGAALGMEPDALAAAYARALGAHGPISRRSNDAGGFRGIAAPPRRRATMSTGTAVNNSAPVSAPRATRRTAAKRVDASALQGGFAALHILNEQPANAAS